MKRYDESRFAPLPHSRPMPPIKTEVGGRMSYEEEDLRSNVLIVPTEEESMEDIIEDYVIQALSCETDEDFRALFLMCFEEALCRIEKHYAVELALNMIERIKEIDFDLNSFHDFD